MYTSNICIPPIHKARKTSYEHCSLLVMHCTYTYNKHTSTHFFVGNKPVLRFLKCTWFINFAPALHAYCFIGKRGQPDAAIQRYLSKYSDALGRKKDPFSNFLPSKCSKSTY